MTEFRWREALRERRLGIAAIAGLATLALFSLTGFLVTLERLLGAYLVACLFWLGLTLGSLALFMLHRITGGHWGQFIQAPLKAAMAPLPLLALLFVPLVITVATIFPWAPNDSMATKLIQKKALYLNIPFFQLRTIGYFLVWMILALSLKPWQSRPVQGGLLGRSALGLILYGLTVTFFMVDWVMSLEPRWYSTAIGFVAIAAQLAAALALAIVIMGWREPNAHKEHFQDLGNLLLAAVMFWIYVVFMQYLIIWSGNLPHEIEWYLHRTQHGWDGVAIATVLCFFVLPFTLLLSRRIKRSPSFVAGAAALVILAFWLDLFWLITPVFHSQGVPIPWLEGLATFGVGGLWLTFFLGFLRIQTHPSPESTPSWSTS